MMMPLLRIASRTSRLAMVQTTHVQAHLCKLWPDLDIEIVGIKTQGDLILDQTLAKIGGKGLFVKELEHALLSNEADLAVHSMKDMPYQEHPDLVLAAIMEREDPRDALISRASVSLKELPAGAVVGTSSLRRQMHLLHHRADLNCRSLRGNVLTRLQKLEQGEYEAIILAYAGLKRLGLENVITEAFSVNNFLPAVGQGAIGVQCRRSDLTLQERLKPLESRLTTMCVQAERAMNTELKGSCSVPISGFAFWQDEQLVLEGRVGLPDGSKIISKQAKGREPAELGYRVGQMLLEAGAQEIIDASR